MEATLRRLIQLSSELVGRLQNAETEALDTYITERDALFGDLQQRDFTAEEKLAHQQDVVEILRMDQLIMGRMEELKGSAVQEIRKLASTRAAKASYEDTYKNNSYFVDTKQ